MNVSRSCSYFGISRSAYYASCQSVEREAFAEQIVVEMVQKIRHKMPRIGGRKLYHLLQADLEKVGKIGRDKFFGLLRKNGLLVERKKSYTRTTDSYHRFHKYNNLLYNNEITRSNQCWVADITYLRTLEGFVYLFLITDYYSRKIVGWSLSHSLSIEGGLLALQMAVKQRDNDLSLIHHSDRGIQYCSNDYVNLLQTKGIKISMTEQNHCYENAKAERVNGILKDEFLLDSTLFGFKINTNIRIIQGLT
ncbi:integrase [Bacteroidia bacterium]|nr:integrase [Bacteroidia bacterium]